MLYHCQSVEYSQQTLTATSLAYGNCRDANLWTLYEVLHEVHTIKIRDHPFDARNNLCQRLNTRKNASEAVLRIRKIQVLS